MAYQEDGAYLAFPAASDFSSTTGSNSQKLAVVLNSSGNLAIAGANVRILGVMIDDPKAGAKGTVQTRDTAKAIAGSAIALTAPFLKTNGSGQLIPCTTPGTDIVVAQALAAATGAGSVIPVRLITPGIYF
jgi:hypothetical protein